MRRTSAPSPSISPAWLTAVAAGLGLIVAVYNELVRGSGVAHTYGALAVVISSALVLLVALALTFLLIPGWPRTALRVLLFLGIIGTACAAYFLEAHLLLAAMVLALFGWFIGVGEPVQPSRNSASPAAIGRA